jgi:hypothetical protein
MAVKPKTSVEKYKEMGLVQFTVWIDADVAEKIRTLAFLKKMTHAQVLAAQFKEVKVSSEKNTVILKFDRKLEKEPS